jgi:hypothetical protein
MEKDKTLKTASLINRGILFGRKIVDHWGAGEPQHIV